MHCAAAGFVYAMKRPCRWSVYGYQGSGLLDWKIFVVVVAAERWRRTTERVLAAWDECPRPSGFSAGTSGPIPDRRAIPFAEGGVAPSVSADSRT